MLKLFWGKHTCAIGTHLLLEEIGAPYETEEIDVAAGATHQAPFNLINPKEKVPALLREDGVVLTEFGAIGVWLARTYPSARLLPADPEQERVALEVLDYVVGTLHAQGFGRIFKPQNYEPQDTLHQTLKLGTASVKQQGEIMATKAFALLSERLGSSPYITGESFSIADAALFYTERWAPQVHIDLPTNLASHLARIKARPAAARVLRLWGE